MKRLVNRFWPFLLMIFVLSLAYLPVISFQASLKWDVIDAVFSWKYLIGESLQNYQLPLWNPYQLGGSPLHADPQSTAWYPITWFIGYFFGYSIYSLTFDWFFHFLIAAFGMYRLGLHFVAKREVAIIMALAYSLSGFFVGNAQHINWLIAAAWIPWLLYSFLSIYKSRKWKYAFLFSVFSYLMISGAYPAFGMVLLYLLLLLFGVFSIKIFRNEGGKELVKYLKINVFAAVFSVLNSAVVFVSVYNLLPFLNRTGGLSLHDSLFGPFSFASWKSFLFPFSAVNHDMGSFGTDLSMTNGYFGILLLAFFFVALSYRKKLESWVLLGFGILSLLLSVGDGLPLREFFYNYFPFFNLFPFPAMLRLFAILSFVLIAGEGLSRFLDKPDKKRIFGSFGFFVVLLFFVAQLENGLIFSHFSKMFSLNQLFHFSTESTVYQHLALQFWIQIFFVVSFFLVFLFMKNARSRNGFLILLVGADLVLAANLNAPYTVYDEWQKPRDTFVAMKKLVKDFPPNNMTPIGLNSDVLTPKIGCIWLNINTFNKQIAQDGYNPLILSNYAFLRDSMPDVLLRFGQNPVVYFADSLVFKPEILKNGNAQKWVFIPEKNRSDSFSLGHNDSADIVYNQVFNPHFMVFQSQTTTSRFLVFQQNFYTGWHLFIDGNAATFFRVNHAFMGAKIPAGSHKIEWVFRPKMILIGFWISLVSLLFSLIMILLPEKRTTD